MELKASLQNVGELRILDKLIQKASCTRSYDLCSDQKSLQVRKGGKKGGGKKRLNGKIKLKQSLQWILL